MRWLIYCAAVVRTGGPRMQAAAKADRLSHPNGVHAVMIDLEKRVASNSKPLGIGHRAGLISLGCLQTIPGNR